MHTRVYNTCLCGHFHLGLTLQFSLLIALRSDSHLEDPPTFAKGEDDSMNKEYWIRRAGEVRSYQNLSYVLASFHVGMLWCSREYS